MGVTVSPEELAQQPENLPDPLFNAGVLARIENKESDLQALWRAATASRETPPGGWDLDPYGQPGYGGGVKWRFGMPVTDPRNPYGKTWGDYTAENLAKFPEQRAYWESKYGRKYPWPGLVLPDVSPIDWPKDLKPSVWVELQEKRIRTDPGYAELVRQYRTPAPRTTFMEAFTPAVNVFSSALGGQLDFNPEIINQGWATVQDIVDKKYFEAGSRIYGAIDSMFGGQWFGGGLKDYFDKGVAAFKRLKQLNWKDVLRIELSKLDVVRPTWDSLKTLGII